MKAEGADLPNSAENRRTADMAWRAVRSGLRVEEVPIEFIERELGDSKMNQKIVTEALWRVTQWGVADKLAKSRKLLATVTPKGTN